MSLKVGCLWMCSFYVVLEVHFIKIILTMKLSDKRKKRFRWQHDQVGYNGKVVEFKRLDLFFLKTTIPFGVKSKHFLTNLPDGRGHSPGRGGVRGVCLCKYWRLVTVNLTILFSSAWDICMDLPPVQYTQSTQVFKVDPVYFIIVRYLSVLQMTEGVEPSRL